MLILFIGMLCGALVCHLYHNPELVVALEEKVEKLFENLKRR